MTNSSPQPEQRKIASRPTLSYRLRQHLLERLAAARGMTANDARLTREFLLRPDVVVAAGVADDPTQVLKAGAEFARRPEVAPLVAEDRRAASEFECLCAELRVERAAFAADPAAARAALRPGLSFFQRSQLVQARRTRIQVAVRNLLHRLERRDRQTAAAKSQRPVTAPARRPRARRSHRVVRVAKPADGDSSDGDGEPPSRRRPRARGPPPSRDRPCCARNDPGTDASPCSRAVGVAHIVNESSLAVARPVLPAIWRGR